MMQIVIHIGAHKTASTYLQDRLGDARGRLLPLGVALSLPSDIRPRIAQRKLDRVRLAFGEPSSSACARVLRDDVTRVSDAGITRLVISEENLLGSMRTVLEEKPFYGRAAERLLEVVDACAGHEVTIALSIRNYVSFYPSLWGFCIRKGYFPFNAELRSRLLARRGEWREIVKGLSEFLPDDVRLIFWQYEDFGALERQVFSLLVGEQGAAEIKSSKHRPLSGPSRRAVLRMEVLEREGALDNAAVMRVLRTKSKAKGFKAFDPWTDLERVRLTRRYKMDIDAITGMPGVSQLSP